MKKAKNTIVKKGSKTTKHSYTLDELLKLLRNKKQVNCEPSPEEFGEALADRAIEKIRREVVI